MTETRDVNTGEPEGEDLIPKDQLPTDPAELGKSPEAAAPAEPAAPVEEGTPAEPETPAAPESSPAAPAEKPEPAPSQPAPVEGETPREKALRLEIQRLRGINRKEDVKKLTEDAAPAPLQEDQYKSLRDRGYTDEQIKDMETVIDVIASSKGYVRADRSYATTVQDTVDLFTEAHPEYLPANDTDDLRWNRFQSLLKDGTYNLSGKSPKQLTAIFEKVDADVRKEFGEVVVKTNPKQVAAQQHKVTVASHSGGTKAAPAAPAKRDHTQAGGVKLVGFSPEDLE